MRCLHAISTIAMLLVGISAHGVVHAQDSTNLLQLTTAVLSRTSRALRQNYLQFACFITLFLFSNIAKSEVYPEDRLKSGQLSGSIHALLVGVSSYPNLSSHKQLSGPANDVAVMHRSLLAVGVKAERITVLADRSALSSSLPTRAAILHQLNQAAQRLHAGDRFVVYFSGHGTQQPVDLARRAATASDEPDGLDEVFLPYDTKRWNPQKSEIEGALIDDEIADALRPLLAKGIWVWAIFDTCHAGDMTKSIVLTGRIRAIEPQELGVPGTSLFPARAHQASGKAHSSYIKKLRSPPDQLIAFFASQPNEPAQEELLPTLTQQSGIDPSDKRYYGVFTYHLAQLLPQSGGNLAKMATQLAEIYRTKPFPRPMFEGSLKTVPNFFQPQP